MLSYKLSVRSVRLSVTLMICVHSFWQYKFYVGACEASRFENFRIGRACPLRVVVKRLKPLTALSSIHRLASSMNDHTPVLFNVFEDWNGESIVPHISFVSFCFVGVDSIRDSIRIRIVTPDSIRVRFERKRPIRRCLVLCGHSLDRECQTTIG